MQGDGDDESEHTHPPGTRWQPQPQPLHSCTAALRTSSATLNTAFLGGLGMRWVQLDSESSSDPKPLGGGRPATGSGAAGSLTSMGASSSALKPRLSCGQRAMFCASMGGGGGAGWGTSSTFTKLSTK